MISKEQNVDSSPLSITPSLDPATVERVRATRLGISLDAWAVIFAIILAVLIRFHVLPAIAWFT